MWTKPQRRCFQRAISGFKVGQYKGQRVRFMTLTTSPLTAEGLNDDEKLELIQRDFRAFKRRIEREFGSFDYLSIRTLEGNGVIHILFRGCYIPHSLIVENWNELHGSYIIDIRKPRGSPFIGARYVVSQYLSNQRTPYFVYGCSKDWVYKGFVKDWNRLKKDCFDFDNGFDKIRLLNEWDNFLKFKSKGRSKFFEVPLEVFDN